MPLSRSSPGPADSQQTLKPMSYMRPHSAHLLSPASDIVGPSPVTSNGTETTEIDDEEQESVSPPAVTEAENAPQVGAPQTHDGTHVADGVEASIAQNKFARSYTKGPK